MSLDGFSMSKLVSELSLILTGGRIDRINHPTRSTLTIVVRVTGYTHYLNISINPQNPIAYLIATPLENPPEPSSFCMLLRKQLEGGRIARISQYGLDRLILIDIDIIARNSIIITKTIAIELMGKYSNIILTENNIIIDSLRRVGTNNSRVRTILKGGFYALPPQQNKLNLLTEIIIDNNADKILKPLISTEMKSEKLVKALVAAYLGFGPISAREVCYLSGLDTNISLVELDNSDFNAIYSALKELVDLLQSPEYLPTIVLDQNKKILGMAAFPLNHLKSISDTKHHNYNSMSELLIFADKTLSSYTPPDKERYERLIRNEIQKANEKLEKLRLEIHDAQNAEEQKIIADNLMTYQHQYSDHVDKEIIIPNIYSDSCDNLTIPLNQRLTLMQNVQNYYKKYDKLKRAKSLLNEQYELCLENIAYLETIETSLSTSNTITEVAEIGEELILAGYLKEKIGKKNKDKTSKPITITTPDKTTILIGRNNIQNDNLTFKLAQKNDIWLHTKDIAGSHVIIKTCGKSPTPATLQLAAELAAYFSKAKNSSNVPVDYTEVRYLKKPSGAKAGFVVFTHQKTIFVTPNEERLTAYLKQF